MRVFYSSELAPTNPLVRVCTTLGVELVHQSLITFEAIPNKPRLPYDVVFFSSPRAYEFGKHSITPDTKIACISKGTAAFCDAQIAWHGNTPGNPNQTAQEFKAWAGKKRILFPVSDRSLGSISQVFPDDQIEVISVYSTRLSPRVITPCDLYVFTSPSNVASYLKLNIIPPHAKVIAWGLSTEHALKAQGINPVYSRNTEESMDWSSLLVSWLNP